jgi:hypothetical protein
MRKSNSSSEKSSQNPRFTIPDAQNEPRGIFGSLSLTDRGTHVEPPYDEQTGIKIHVGTAIL